jgi:hypothetical protein
MLGRGDGGIPNFDTHFVRFDQSDKASGFITGQEPLNLPPIAPNRIRRCNLVTGQMIDFAECDPQQDFRNLFFNLFESGWYQA